MTPPPVRGAWAGDLGALWLGRLKGLAPSLDPTLVRAIAALLANSVGPEVLLIVSDAVRDGAKEMQARGRTEHQAELLALAADLGTEAASRGEDLSRIGETH